VTKSEDALCLEMHFASDLSAGRTVDRLQSWLSTSAPRMFDTFEVHAYERDPNRLSIDRSDPHALRHAVRRKGLERGDTYAQLSAQDPPPALERHFGHVLLRGRGTGTTGRYVSVDFDSMIPARPSGSQWLWSNSVGASVKPTRVEGVSRPDWICSLARELAEDENFLWGAAYLDEEFPASNLDTTRGLRAIGRDVRRYLPGLYWLNFFGAAYTELMDVIAAEAMGVGNWQRIGQTLTLECHGDPEGWRGFTTQKHQLLNALGADLFFDRRRPERDTRAPDLGLVPLPDSRPFQVLTSDGVNFTPLPPI
jgi:hypothetical protein